MDVVAALLIVLGSAPKITEIMLSHWTASEQKPRPASAAPGISFDADHFLDERSDGTITFTGTRDGKEGAYTARFGRRRFARMRAVRER